MRTTLDLPDGLFKQAKIAAVTSGCTLRELMTEALRRYLLLEQTPARIRLTEAPIKLPAGHAIALPDASKLPLEGTPGPSA